MKKLILIWIFIFIICFVDGQVSTKFYSNGDALMDLKPFTSELKANKIIEIPSFDVQKLIEEDKTRMRNASDIPFRFGKAFYLNLDLNRGEWVDYGNGRVWSIEFKSVGAFSINMVFDQFYLPDGALLYVINSTNTILYGPVTSKQNPKSGYFMTDLIPGDDISLYLFEPLSQKGKSELRIKSIVHAYKKPYSDFSYGNLGGSESCNNDIICFPEWGDESDAVALVLLSEGTEWCSGSLLMSTSPNFRPFFLSAFHCVDVDNPKGSLSASEKSNAENWLFKFQYKMSSCGGSTATTSVTYNGAEFRSGWNQSDFVLMELDNSPVGDSRFSWLGWDRTTNIPNSGTGIHHPSGDVMKISFDNNQFQTSSWGGTNNHWLLNFDDGVAEHGSSGSPILDQNGRVVGQLHGNQYYDPLLPYCTQPRAEYGRFNLSWTGGGADTTRLSNWLDACGTGTSSTNTLRSPYITGYSLVCYSPNKTFNLYNNVADSVYWTKSSNLYIVSGQNTNSLTVRAQSSYSSGEGWVQANLYNESCDVVTIHYDNFWVGIPQPTITGEQFPGCGDINWYFLDPEDRWGTYSWSVTNGLSILGTTSGYKAQIRADEEGSSFIYCDVNNTCGTNYGSLQVLVGSCFDFLLYPNPANDYVEIRIDGTKTDIAKINEYDIKIINSQNIIISNQKTFQPVILINTAKLVPGSYFVQLIYNGKSYAKQLVISH